MTTTETNSSKLKWKYGTLLLQTWHWWLWAQARLKFCSTWSRQLRHWEVSLVSWDRQQLWAQLHLTSWSSPVSPFTRLTSRMMRELRRSALRMEHLRASRKYKTLVFSLSLPSGPSLPTFGCSLSYKTELLKSGKRIWRLVSSLSSSWWLTSLIACAARPCELARTISTGTTGSRTARRPQVPAASPLSIVLHSTRLFFPLREAKNQRKRINN